MRIVFFGTPEFAVPSLNALIATGFEVAAVVTQPDKPRGRSRSVLHHSPVKVIADDFDIPVLQPDRPAGDVFAETLHRFRPDLGVVVAYGHILKPAILQIPRLGMVNLHASLLPRLRGAAPIQWAIINGEPETGVSIMQMEAGLDSGPVYCQVPTPIGPDETGGDLADRLAQLGAGALIETLTAMGREGEEPGAREQRHAAATYAPKIQREHRRIDWTEGAAACARRIRAFDPEPGAWTTWGGQEIKLFSARPHQQRAGENGGAAPGLVLQAGERLSVATGAGSLLVREVQPSGKRRMPVADWVRGRGIKAGAHFE